MRTVRRKDPSDTRPLPAWARRACASVKLGDKIHAAALPVAVALKMDCVDPETKKLRPESKCAGRRRRWNGEPDNRSPSVDATPSP